MGDILESKGDGGCHCSEGERKGGRGCFSEGDSIGDREGDIAARVKERVVGSVSSEGHSMGDREGDIAARVTETVVGVCSARVIELVTEKVTLQRG